ncbi:HNH endonuclease family protein [Marinobacter sp.]|uniref:HNH endonuclease family protein n=1 Tax=Marinobacter sp. TaxID=50741 RepID=UPI003561FE9C
MRFLKFELVPLFGVLLVSSLFAADLPVKKSESGICHPPMSPWYERTEHFDSYSTFKHCLSSGGRLPRGLSTTDVVSARETGKLEPEYQRANFGQGWDDKNGDCQDSRAEALIASSTTQVQFASKRKCRVVTGRWISPFTGEVIQNSGNIDIDHVVPLAWAWRHGAEDWRDEKRERFANDPVNLWPVEASLNRSKGAQGPDQWLPPSGQCQYVARFSRLVKQYDLQTTPRERGWIKKFLEECR